MEYTIRDIKNMLTESMKLLGSQKALAEDMDISPQYLNDFLLGRRGAGKAILKYLNLERRITYHKR